MADNMNRKADRMAEISEKYGFVHSPTLQDTARVLELLSVTLERGIERGDLGMIHDAGDMVPELLEFYDFWSVYQDDWKPRKQNKQEGRNHDSAE